MFVNKLDMFVGLVVINMAWLLNGRAHDDEANQLPTKRFIDLEEFGTLHTLEILTSWANKEETIRTILGKRLLDLRKEAGLIEIYMEAYKRSSGLTPNKREFLQTSTEYEQRKCIGIGNDTMLPHVLANHYTNYVNPIREIYSTNGSKDIKENIMKILSIQSEGQSEEDHSFENFFLQIDEAHKLSQFPGGADLYNSHQAIIHIQEIYGLTPEQLYKGSTFNSNSGGRLTAVHCANIGMFALEKEYYFMAIEWLELAKELLGNENDKSISINMVSKFLDLAIDRHNRELFATADDEAHYQMYFYSDAVYVEDPKSERTSVQAMYLEEYSSLTGNESLPYTSFLGLCSGQDYQPLENKSRLKCYLERTLHPYFILNPVKTEQLSEYPFIVQMYDVLGNDTIQDLYRVRGSSQLSSMVALNGGKTRSNKRSSIGFLVEDTDVTERITRKTEILTGLWIDREHDEGLQVVEYTYGRYYAQHKDTFSEEQLDSSRMKWFSESTGNRLATVLYYIEEPDFGGETPFCEAGIAAKSTRGSAVFWINLFRNGTVRPDVTHGACPVMHGNKIIMNRWIGYKANFQSFKCSLNPND